MTHSLEPLCKACRHLDRDQERHLCDAFPEGIPEEIWTNRFDHHDPYPGDRGIRFELMAVEEHAAVKERVS
jgi:hypothetical protein